MVKKQTVRRIFRRAKTHRRRGMTAVKLMKLGIALTPVATSAFDGWKDEGVRGIGRRFMLAYTGKDLDNLDSPLNTTHLITVGYGPLLAAWLFGKIASRVLR